jgi:hypothetical protein
MISIHKACLAALLPLAFAGCSGGTSSLSTGSLFGSKQADAVAAAPVETPSMRAAQVSAVSARAAKCGYNFDPARLRSGFLANEMNQGAAAQDLAKIEREYDTIRAKVASTIAADPDYCTDARTRQIKADLTRHLAGDYTSPESQKKLVDERLLASGPRARETLNPDFVNDKWASKTKRVEE